MKKWKWALPLILMVVFALTRWPGLLPGNFSAAYALAFCAGVYFSGRIGWWLPLGTLLLSDILMNLFYYRADAVSAYMLVNYLAFGAIIWLGRQFSARSSWFALLGGGILGAILFYLITNSAAWIQNPAYAKTLAGWIQALTVGTPGWPHTWEFFRNTLLSGGLFTAVFTGAMKLSEMKERETEQEEEEAPVESEHPIPEELNA
jgi:hypothetical protein